MKNNSVVDVWTSFKYVYPAGIYLLKVNNRDTKTRGENMFKINSKNTRTTPMVFLSFQGV